MAAEQKADEPPKKQEPNIQMFNKYFEDHCNMPALTPEIQKLYRALDLGPFIVQTNKLLSCAIKVPATHTRPLPGMPQIPVQPPRIFSVSGIFPNERERKIKISRLIGDEKAKGRRWLKKTMMAESDSDSDPNEMVLTQQDLRSMIKIHKTERRMRRKYHTSASNQKYAYYSTGLSSTYDPYPTTRKALIRALGDGKRPKLFDGDGCRTGSVSPLSIPQEYQSEGSSSLDSFSCHKMIEVEDRRAQEGEANEDGFEQEEEDDKDEEEEEELLTDDESTSTCSAPQVLVQPKIEKTLRDIVLEKGLPSEPFTVRNRLGQIRRIFIANQKEMEENGTRQKEQMNDELPSTIANNHV